LLTRLDASSDNSGPGVRSTGRTLGCRSSVGMAGSVRIARIRPGQNQSQPLRAAATGSAGAGANSPSRTPSSIRFTTATISGANPRLTDLRPTSAIRPVSSLLAVTLVSKYPIDGGATNTQRCRDGAGRLTAGVHPLGQGHLRLVQRLRATDGLPACPPGLACCAATLSTKFEFKLRKAG
jgi:hypothetical protein